MKKVLLDENLDHTLRKLLGHCEVVTVAYMGWAGLKNGELLRTAEASGVDVFLTGDTTLNHEQNLEGRRLAVVALSAIQLPIIRQHLPNILTAIDSASPGSFQAVIAAHSAVNALPANLCRKGATGIDRHLRLRRGDQSLLFCRSGC